MNEKYDHKDIENKWQAKWAEDKAYETPDKVEGKNNFYTLVEFPYPSGNLHVGHWYAFAVPDIFARAKRMKGFNVLYPIGFDAFGLPAENAAIKRGLNPKKWTYENIEYMEKQLESMGASFDWSRKVVTSDPEYYKWTQWLFLKLYEKGLAYKKKANVNWCPKDQTVLANEQVVQGRCERCGSSVEQKDLEQWFFKITDYAERLISDLELLDWPEPIKDSQRNWIGKSEGVEIDFELRIKNYELSDKIKIFTTRADTLFGATYLVLAPEHKIIKNLKLKIENWEEVEKYVSKTKNKTEIDRTSATREKTGVRLDGVVAINPATGEEISVWVADYVLDNYGTGAVMAVPAHDERDFEFAKKYELPIKEVVIPVITDNSNPHVAGKEVVFRDAVIVVLRNPKTGKFLCLKWKKHPWITFVMGGIEEGETDVEAAQRELKEETGYKNFKFVRHLGSVQSEFFATHKDVNRVAHTRELLFELVDEEREEISEEEKEIHELEWRSWEEINKPDMTHSEMPIILERMESGYSGYFGEGVLFNSGEFNRMNSEEAREKIAQRFGKKVTKYKLRDWLLSRQRYWGCPIPIVYDPEGNPHPVPEEHLPWKLPEDDIDFTPKGEAPLVSSRELKERTEKIFGKGWKPEIDTMDTFVDSSWYFLRYCDPRNQKEFSNKENQGKWMPVKMYSGGAEHTTMHLLYSRFFHKALFDLGLVNENEPFKKRMNRGLILGPDGQKMSKSKGNVIDPGEWVEKMGADTVRMYLAFVGPFNEVGQYPWHLGGIAGLRRFLERVWNLRGNVNENNYSEDQKNKIIYETNKTIKKVTEDIEVLKFNTAISQLMIYLNFLGSLKDIMKEEYETFLKLLAPFAPHITEELWHGLGHNNSIHLENWPEYDEGKTKKDKAVMVVQINGKVRAQFEIDIDAKEEDVKEKVLKMEDLQKWFSGKSVQKTIFIKHKLINFVVI